MQVSKPWYSPSKCVLTAKESAEDRRLLKAKGLALTFLVTFEPFCSYLKKKKSVFLLKCIIRPPDCPTEKWAEIRVNLLLTRESGISISLRDFPSPRSLLLPLPTANSGSKVMVKISNTFTLEKPLSQQRNPAVGELARLRTRSFLQGYFLSWIRGALALHGRYHSVGGRRSLLRAPPQAEEPVSETRAC